MKQWISIAFLFTWLMPGVIAGQTTEMQSPLDDFLALLENSGANMLVMNVAGHEDGAPFQFPEFARFNGDHGLGAKIFGEDEQRWIVNPYYSAKIEKSGQGKWVLQQVSATDTALYKKLQDSDTTAGWFFGTPLLSRIKSLDPSYTRSDSDNSLYEYQFSSDSPFFSKNSALNAMTFRFDQRSEEPRLIEIKHSDSVDPDSKVVLETVATFSYPDGSLFPVNISARGVVLSGSIPGIREEDLWTRIRIEFDKETMFNRSECYLAHYGLPEPKGLKKPWPIWIKILGAGLVFVAVALVIRKMARK